MGQLIVGRASFAIRFVVGVIQNNCIESQPGRQPESLGFEVTQIAVVRQVFDQAVLFLIIVSTADRQLAETQIDTGTVKAGTGNHIAPSAAGKPLLETKFATRAAGHQIQRSANGIPTVQGALRAAQYLDALDVIDIESSTNCDAKIDPIDIDPNGGLDDYRALTGSDSANGHAVVVLTGGLLPYRQVRNVFADISGLGDTEILEISGTEYRQRDRRILQRFLALLSGYHDLFEGLRPGL